MLAAAKNLLRRHQHNRDVCKKKLLVPHYRVLLQDIGAGDKLKRKGEDGKIVQARREDLVAAYWEIHVDVPGSVPSETETVTPAETETVTPPGSTRVTPTPETGNHHICNVIVFF